MKKIPKVSKKGFTIIEIIIVLAIIAVLLGAMAFAGNNSVHRTRVQSTSSFLQVFGADMETVFEDYGPLVVDDADVKREVKIREYLKKLASDYLHTEFMLGQSVDFKDSLKLKPGGFVVATKDVDPWGMPYKLYYQTTVDANGDYLVVSFGKDMKSSEDTYSTGIVGDDIILSVTNRR